MKKNLLKTMLVAVAMVMGANTAWADGETTANVKMTYVDFNNPDASNGEVTECVGGYNKITAEGTVGFGNTSWGVNKIIYLQVDASATPGTVMKATLKAEVTGSTDSKRTTGWGVGYNASNWSSELTYNTADLSITLCGANSDGDPKWTSTKSSGTWEEKEFDVTSAFTGDADKIVTLIVYELAAAGGNFTNPTVTIQYTDRTMAKFTIKYVDTEGIELKPNTEGFGFVGDAPEPANTCFAAIKKNGVKYIYKSDDAESKIVAADGSTVVTITFEEAPLYHYVLNSNLGLGALGEGDEYADEKVLVPFPKYQYYARYKKLFTTTQNPTGDGYFVYGMEMNEPNVSAEVQYDMENPIEDVVFYAEGEAIEGMSATSSGNANIRCSNATGGYNATEGNVTVTTLEPGNYIIYTMVWGNKTENTPMNLVVGDQTLALTTMGYLQEYTMEVKVTSSTPVEITPGGDSSGRTLDYIYIKSVPETVNFTVKSTTGQTIYEGSYYQGVETTVAVPKYILNQETEELYMTANNGSKGYYLHGITPEYDGQVFEIEYELAKTGVVFYAEAEDLEGMTKATGSNANIRCSMGAGGYNATENAITAYTVTSSDNYILTGAVWGGADIVITVNAGTNAFVMTTNGSHTEFSSEEVYALSSGDQITIPAGTGNGSHPLDYIFLQKATATGIQGVKQVISESNAIFNLAGQEVKTALKGVFIQNGKKVVK